MGGDGRAMGGRWAGDRRQGDEQMGGRQWAAGNGDGDERMIFALLHFARCNQLYNGWQTESCRKVQRARTTENAGATSSATSRKNGGICFKRPPAFPKVLLPTLRDPVHLRAAHAIRAVVGDG